MSLRKGTNVVGLGFIVNIFMLSILPWNRIIKDAWRGWKNGPLSYKKNYIQTTWNCIHKQMIQHIIWWSFDRNEEASIYTFHTYCNLK